MYNKSLINKNQYLKNNKEIFFKLSYLTFFVHSGEMLQFKYVKIIII